MISRPSRSFDRPLAPPRSKLDRAIGVSIAASLALAAAGFCVQHSPLQAGAAMIAQVRK